MWNSADLNGSIYDQNMILNPYVCSLCLWLCPITVRLCRDYSLNTTAYEIYGQPWQSSSQVVRV